VPLTLSVINTLLVTIDSITYAIPELNVEHIVRVCGNTGSKRLEKLNKSLVLIYDGRILPVITMNEIEAKAKGSLPVSADTVLKRCRLGGVTKCLVLRADGRNFALLIDNAIETEQILVKPLPVYLQNCPCYLSVTVLGNGKAVTILDAAGIIRFMGIENIEKEIVQQFLPETEVLETGKVSENEKQVIIFKCSGKEYFAVETADILRIESLKTKDIQEINDGLFVNITGVTRRVVRPEDYVPVIKKEYTGEKLYLLTLKNSVSSIGLLAGKVIDKAEGVFTLDGKQIYSDFIFGTSVFNEKILIFLNTAAISENVENGKTNKRIVMEGEFI